jgi:uncharacterized membrane protein
MIARLRTPRVMAGFLAAMGILHFVVPAPFDEIVPESLPGGQRRWTYLSGVAELGTAAAVAAPRTRRLGGLLAVGLFLGVFPANVKMALDWADRPAWQQALAWGRLPLQIPLVLWALRVRREA